MFAVLWQAVLIAADDFLHWMGYFTAIFMMALQPGIFGEHVYAATPWIMLGALTFGTMYMLRALFVKALGMPRDLCRCVTMILLLMTVQCLVGRNEALYWYCGAVNYTFFYGIALFYLGTLLSAVYDKARWKRRCDLVLACFLGIMVGGGNYMTALTVAIVVASAVILMICQKALFRLRALLLPIACFAAAFAASCLAPGNAYRSEITQGMGAVKAVFVSLYYFFDYCVSDWTTWAVLAGFLLMIPFIWKMVRSTDFPFPFPLLTLLFGYGLTSANVTPPLYAIGNIGAGRLQALFFMQYLLLMTLCMVYALGWLSKYLEKRQKERGVRAEDKNLSYPAFVATAALAVFIIFASALCVYVDPYYYTASSAVTDLMNGSAKAYGEAYEERVSQLKDPDVSEVIFEPLPAEPELLFFSDITGSMDSWENRAIARFYGKESVVVEGR
ncbi:MAG: DUF6056 family protein [Eubacteriales bacterium]|nr:DUF6056 family protein [Eubacteriales bacterium]